MNTYKPNEFADMIGVSVKTLQRWDNEGKLIAFRNPSNRRYYTHNQYIKYMSNAQNIISFTYRRSEQKENLIKYAISIECEEVE